MAKTYTADETNPSALTANETVTINNGAVITITSATWAAATAGTFTITWGELKFVNSSTSVGYIISKAAASGAAWASLGPKGKLTAEGNQISIGTGNGNANQTVTHWDSTGEYCPAVWIETGSGTGIYEKYLNLTGGYVAHTTDFSYVGAGIYGRFFTQSGATLTFGDGTNGKCPPNGANIKVPNIIFTYAGAYGANPWYITPSSNGGFLNLDMVQMSRVTVYFGQWLEFNVLRCSIGDYCSKGNSSTLYFDDCGFTTLHSEVNTLIDFEGYYISDKLTLKNCAGWMSGAGKYCVVASVFAHIEAPDSWFMNIRTTSTSWTALAIGSYGITCEFNADGLLCVGGMSLGGTYNITDMVLTENPRLLENNTNGARYGITTSSEATVSGRIDGVYTPSGGGFYAAHIAFSKDIIDLEITNVICESTYQGYFLFFLTRYMANVKRRNLLCGSSRSAYWGVSSATLIGGDFINVKNTGTLDSSQYSSWPYSQTSVKKFYTTETATVPLTGQKIDIGFMDLRSSTTEGFIRTLFFPMVELSNETHHASVTYDGAGKAYLPSTSGWIIIESDYKILGVTSFHNTAPLIRGGSTGNLTFEYDLNTGSGYSGSWTALTAANLIAETLDEVAGFYIKYRITVNTASTATYIDSLIIYTDVDDTIDYPLDMNTLTFTGIPSGAEYRIYEDSETDGTIGTVELMGEESFGGGSVVYSFPETDAGNPIILQVMAAGYKEYLYPINLPSTPQTIGVILAIEKNT